MRDGLVRAAKLYIPVYLVPLVRACVVWCDVKWGSVVWCSAVWCGVVRLFQCNSVVDLPHHLNIRSLHTQQVVFQFKSLFNKPVETIKRNTGKRVCVEEYEVFVFLLFIQSYVNHYTTLHYTALHYTTLHRTTLH
jgi:hypothetical protein